MTDSTTDAQGQPQARWPGVKQRDVITMSDAEVDEFLHGRHTMTMSTFAVDGTIHSVAMWYGFVDGCVAVEAKTKSQKVRNLHRDPRITCLVHDGERYEELRGVQIVGRVEVLDDPEILKALMADISKRYSTQSAGADDATLARLTRNRVALRVRPDRVVTWDHRKLSSRG